MSESIYLESKDSVDDDLLAIDLRIRLLECVVVGALPESETFTQRIQQPIGNNASNGLGHLSTQASVGCRAERVLRELRSILDAKPNEAIRRFVESYDLNEPLLHLPNQLLNQRESFWTAPLNMQEKLELVFEAESEISQLEKDLRDIELLDQRGFTGAGKLAEGDYSSEELEKNVVVPLEETKRTTADLEARATAIMSRYDSYVNSLSEIFISWDDILSAVENEVARLQQGS